MATSLVPCSGCGRHVRVADSACPFCGASISDELRAKVIPSTTRRLGRNAAFAFATTLALGACAPAQQPAGDASNDSAADSASNDSGEQPDSSIVAMYGAPAVDSGADSAPDGGGTAPLYGGPVPVDAGDSDSSSEDAGSDGNPGTRYGAPPPDRDV